MSAPYEKSYIEDRLGIAVAEVRAEMAKNTTHIIQWLVGLWFTSIVLIICAVIVIVHGAVRDGMPAAAVTPLPQPPIIIQLPPQAWTQQGPPPAAPPQKP